MIQAIEKLCSNSCQGSNVFAHFTIDFHQGHLSSNRDILYVFACSMLPSWCPMIFPCCLRTTPCRTAWHQAPTKAFEFLARSWKQGIFYQTENKKVHSLTFLFPGNQLTLLTVAKSALRLDTRVTVHATYILWEHCDWQTLKPKPTALPTQSFQSAISLWSQLLEVAMKANCLRKSSGSSPVRMQLQKQSEIFWPWSELSTYHTKRDQNRQAGDVHSHAKSLYDSQPKTCKYMCIQYTCIVYICVDMWFTLTYRYTHTCTCTYTFTLWYLYIYMVLCLVFTAPPHMVCGYPQPTHPPPTHPPTPLHPTTSTGGRNT